MQTTNATGDARSTIEAYDTTMPVEGDVDEADGGRRGPGREDDRRFFSVRPVP